MTILFNETSELIECPCQKWDLIEDAKLHQICATRCFVILLVRNLPAK